MAEEGHISARNHGRKEASAPMECGTPPEILLVETAFNFPLFPSQFIFTSLWLFLAHLLLVFWLFFGFFNKALLQWLFQYLFKPKGVGTFSTALNFMEEYSGYAVSILLQDRSPRNGRTQPGHKIILVHEVDDHTKGHDPIPRNEWTQPWSLIQNPQSGRTN